MGYKKMHLACWRSLSHPRLLGGWGIKRLKEFNRALCAKSFWRMLFDKGFWGATVQAKYLKGLDPATWLCNFISAPGICSVVWRSLLKTCPIIKRSLCWEVGRGIQISVGSDPILGLGEHYTLSGALL